MEVCHQVCGDCKRSGNLVRAVDASNAEAVRQVGQHISGLLGVGMELLPTEKWSTLEETPLTAQQASFGEAMVTDPRGIGEVRLSRVVCDRAWDKGPVTACVARSIEDVLVPAVFQSAP